MDCGFSATRTSARPDAVVPPNGDPRVVGQTYGVIWRHGHEPLARGRLELGPTTLHLIGTTMTADVAEEIDYADLCGVHVGRSVDERIDGHRTLVLERHGLATLAIAGIAEAGILGELTDRLVELQHANARRRAAVVVPLLPGSRAAVEELLDAGPPFDPAALGLEQHCVYLTDEEVVFVFAWRGTATIDSLVAEPGFWQSAAAWQHHIAGPPRVAEPAYIWTRPASAADLNLLPPGLHASPE
jgi:hypothetical protein